VKILLVNDYATPTAGAEISAKMLLDGLRTRGHEVRFFSSRAELVPGASYADDLCFGTNSRFQVISSTFNLSARRSLARVLDEFRPDVVHVKMFLWQLSPLILGPLYDYPSIYHAVVYKPICPTGWKMLPDGTRCESQPGLACLRDGCLTPQSWTVLMVQNRLWRRDMRAFDTMVTTSSAMKERLEAEGLGPIRIIPNGCEERRARPPLGSEPQLAYAGRLSAEKGVDTLLRAFERLLEQIPGARLVIVGDGPRRDSLQELARQLEIADEVEFTGSLPTTEMERRLETAWVQAVPSKWDEPFGMVAIEAMMRGTAVLASNGGGLREIVRNGETGLLVAPDDVEAWASALTRLLSDRDRCEAMGAAGRKVALDEYTVDQKIDRIISLYENLLSREQKT
jgi:glycosyltransferase involved in cell wall biosynthesis